MRKAFWLVVILINLMAVQFAFAQTYSPSYSLSVSGAVSFIYMVGQSWTIRIQNAAPGTLFSLCGTHGTVTGCTPNFGTTDQNGNFSQTGYFGSGDVGSWSEWVTFGTTASNKASFTVSATSATSATSALSVSAANAIYTINGSSASGTSYIAGATWMAAISSSLPSSSFSLCGIHTVNGTIVAQGCTPNFGTTDTRGSWSRSGAFATTDVGSWTEWIAFPSGATSSAVSFTIFSATSSMVTASTTNQDCYDTIPDLISEENNLMAAQISANQSQMDSSTLAQFKTALGQKFSSTMNDISASMGCGSVVANQNDVLVGQQGDTATEKSSTSVASVATSSGSSSGNSTIAFPATILVTATSLNVRSAPSTTAALAGSQVLYEGDEFTATNEVVGESVNGNDLWWVSSAGNYIWSGGTEVAGSNGPIAKTVTSGGVQYPVTYSYIPDGEVRATFTYKGKSYAEQNYNLFKTAGGVASVQSNGSFGFPYTGSADMTLLGLANQISSNSPAAQTIFLGFTFETPLYYIDDASPYYVDAPVGAFNITKSPNSNVPPAGLSGIYYLDQNSNGDVVGVTPVNISNMGVITIGTEIPIQSQTVPALTPQQALQNIQSASSTGQAISYAEEAGLTVTPWSDDSDYSNGAVITDPLTGVTLATITEWTDPLPALSSSSTALLGPQFLNTLALSVSTPPRAGDNAYGAENALSGFVSNAFAAGTSAMAVGNNTGQTAVCSVAGTNDAAHLLVRPDGHLYGGGVSSYKFSTQCNNVGGCDSPDDQALIKNAQNFINGLGAAQLNQNSGNDSKIQLQIQNSIVDDANGIALAVSTRNSDGTFSNSCNANIGMQNIYNDFSDDKINVTIGSPQFVQGVTNIIIHEMLHCMGLGHSDNPIDIMDKGAQSADAELKWLSSPPIMDPAEVAVLKQIMASQTISVENCGAICGKGQGYQFIANGSNDECIAQSKLCSDTSKLWSDQTQSCATCQEIGYPDGWVADQGSGVCELEVNGGSMPEVPFAPDCTCNVDGTPSCKDPVTGDAVAPGDFTCVSSNISYPPDGSGD